MKKVELLKMLRQAHRIYMKSMKELEKKYKSMAFSENIHFEKPSSFLLDFEKNFFTLLMISILIKCDIRETRMISYGKIIFCLRNLITSTDNIIDKENKNITQIKGISNLVANNIFNLLLHQTILFQELESIEVSSALNEKVLEEILFIAESEGRREIDLYREYPSTTEVEEKIHRGIGGKLLEIALVVPLNVEYNKSLKRCSEGLFEIGMSLQALDDLVDMKEDEENRKINLATAFFKEKEKACEHRDTCNDMVKWQEEYLILLLKRAFHGFSILEEEGYPVDKKTSLYLLKRLFIIRGLDKKYLSIFLKESLL